MKLRMSIGGLVLTLGLLFYSQSFSQDEFTDSLFKRANEIAQTIPEKSRCWALSKIAVEHERLGKSDLAKSSWDEALKTAESFEDERLVAYSLGCIAEQKTRAGDYEFAKVLLDKITDPTGADHARSWVAKALTEQSKHQEAVELAETIDKRNRVIFDTMEHIAIRANRDGDLTNAARASRGMDPYGKEHLTRKLRTICHLCAENFQAGEIKAAKQTIEQNKRFAESVEADAHTSAMVAVTWAAFHTDDFEFEFKKVIQTLQEIKSSEDRKVVYSSISQLLVEMGKIEFANKLLDDNEDSELKSFVAVRLAEHYAESGDIESMERTLEKTVDFPLVSSIHATLSKTLRDQGKVDLAAEYLDRAYENLKINAPKMDSQTVMVEIRDLVAVMVSLGQQDRAMKVIETAAADGQFSLNCLIDIIRECQSE